MNSTDKGAEARRLDAAESVSPLSSDTASHDTGRDPAPRRLKALSTHEREGALSGERIDEIRGQILRGAYDSVEVVDRVARRMLEKGDI